MQVQGHISADIDICDEYSIKLSLRRGVTTHILNRDVEERYINADNCWRKERDAFGSVAQSLGMIGVYTKLD